MKKVINITLNSVIFAIEQDAYDVLDAYLEQIKAQLASSADTAEIIADVESAIAEKFVALERSATIAVSLRDVEQMRTQMGAPADFGEASNGETVADETRIDSKSRRLFRDTDDAVIAGVASGIARYFSIDPVLVRIAFVASVFVNGIGILAYIILWLVVPAARTTAERFAMQGKPVTIEDIASSVKKNVKGSNLADPEYVRGTWQSIRRALQQLFAGLGGLLRLAVKVLRYVIGSMFVIGGTLGAAGLISMYSVVLLSDKTFLPLEAQQAVAIMLDTTLGVLAIIASFVVSLIPLLVLLMLGVSLLKKHSIFTTNKTVTLFVIWIIAVALAGTTSALQVEKVWQEIGGDLAGEMELVITEDGMRFQLPVMDQPPLSDAPVPILPSIVTPVELKDEVMCTMDVRECPDGSYVSRSEPGCAFAECLTIAE